MNEYLVTVEVSYGGQSFEVIVNIIANDEDEANAYAEEAVGNNLFIYASECEEVA